MRVRFWGVRGSIPAPGPKTVRYGGNTPCVEITCGDETLIMDAGTAKLPRPPIQDKAKTTEMRPQYLAAVNRAPEMAK